MTVSPYDDYPYPDPGRYPPDQVKHLRIDTAPRRDTWEQWFPGETPAPKRVLVVGCGVYEAIAVAAQEPLLDVVGLDSSNKVIELARSIADMGGVENVRFVHADIMDDPFPDAPPVDLVCASGVLHHVRDADRFVESIRGKLKRAGGLFSVMVYGDCYREFVPRFCDMLKALGIKRDAHGIEFVRGLIKALPDHHPVKQFYANVADYDAQIADLWLHPYFHQYGADELITLMAGHGLQFRRWIEPLATDYSFIEEAPSAYDDIKARFMTLPFTLRCRIGQVLSHADVKLSAVFAR